MKLTVLICTHNRELLLKRALDSLQAAKRPSRPWQVEILVVANACDDGTHALLEREKSLSQQEPGRLPLIWLKEPVPGKSQALNTAIPLIKDSDLIAFVDDDHRVDYNYLAEICRAGDRYPEFSMFCGRILPDWDGSEPAWVHDEGPYRIRPLPIPRSDGGPIGRELKSDDPTPGGGNLFIRGRILERVGHFSPELGPHGHDLGGGEDSAFVEKALCRGERLRYIPGVLQYHYVDPERLRFRYVLRKAFQRAKTTAMAKAGRQGIPLYQWKKLALYLASLVLAFNMAGWRFYLVRISTILGEMAGQQARRWRRDRRNEEIRHNRIYLISLSLATAAGISAAFLSANAHMGTALGATLAAAAVFTCCLALKSLLDFSYAGPRIPQKILAHYRHYIVFSFLRLLGFAFLILSVLAAPGVLAYFSIAEIADLSPRGFPAFSAGSLSIALLTVCQFSRHLLLLPANIAASYNYRISRLYPFWQKLTKKRLNTTTALLLAIPLTLSALAAMKSFSEADLPAGVAYTAPLALGLLLHLWLRPTEAKAVPNKKGKRPNIVMIGSDTLRADRLDGSYRREVAPFIRSLARQGVFLIQCFVPIARTAPSLLSLLTGCWPYRFGVRDNFVPDETTQLTVPTLPRLLKQSGYYTAALSDWCGADLGKFDLGFDYTDVPEDQWNIKLFIRQGPKDLRLFLSLFTRNLFGKTFLPEIYYLGGVPQTTELGREARHLITHLAQRAQPFFLNVFFSTTHGPFGSEYPYYLRYANRDYRGESKFVMARLTDPWEIIRRQAEPRQAFDLDQIIDLYDGCVTCFDDEVRKLCAHLKACGLDENTLVVIYTDHGMEFFEHHTWGQGNSAISDVSSKTPMIIKGLGISPQTIHQPTRSIDLPPTLLELVGIHSRLEQSMDGKSLAKIFHRETVMPDFPIYNETGIWLSDLPGMPKDHLRYPNLIELLTVRNLETGTITLKPEYEHLVIAAKDRWIRQGKWKLIYIPMITGHLLMLFDTESDPDCTRNLSATYPETARMLWERLREWIENDPDAAINDKEHQPPIFFRNAK